MCPAPPRLLPEDDPPRVLRRRGPSARVLRRRGPPALVLLAGLGLDARIWEDLLPLLPADLTVHSPDPGPTCDHMGDRVAALAGWIEAEGLAGAVVLGQGMGGLIAQGLAAERPDLVRALVLTGTATKLGTEAGWLALADRAAAEGMAAVGETFAATLFNAQAPDRAVGRADLWRTRLAAHPPAQFAAGCRAIAGTDLWESTARLTLPVLTLSGARDRAVPPDMMAETARLLPQAQSSVIPRAGHVLAVDAPAALAAALINFMGALHPDEGP